MQTSTTSHKGSGSERSL